MLHLRPYKVQDTQTLPVASLAETVDRGQETVDHGDVGSPQTTRARSIVTLDGYVSRGRDPPSSVARDHAMLQDFAAFLELRLKSLNVSLLRRVFADFLNEQETTLVNMMRLGCSIVTLFPVLRSSEQRRRQAACLLAKPKCHLDPRGCVFLYLQYRAATRNMALLKHMFLEFVGHRETSLLQFVERGNQVISVIPFELPRLVVSVPCGPPAAQRESPRAVETAADQQPVEAQAARPRKKPKRRAVVKHATSKESTTASTGKQPTAASSDAGTANARRVRRTRRKKEETKDKAAAAAEQDAAVSAEPERVAKRRSRRISDAVAVAAVSTTESAAGEGGQDSSVPAASGADVESAPAPGKRPKADAASQEEVAAPPVEVAALPQDPPKTKGGRKRKAKPSEDKKKTGKEKSHKRGKPAMTEATCRSQEELTRKMDAFEEQIPWEAVYSNLPVPFEEQQHPELAKKLHRFWHRHSRAVWERKFWSPMSRKMNLAGFNKRNNRQISAKNAFEAIIVLAYEELGAAFFATLDTQQPRHPGWWYRGPVVALFALQEIKGEGAVWDYVNKEALERFPDCKLPTPLKAANYGAMQSCHKGASDSMWMANHPLTAALLNEIAALKAESQAREARGEQAGTSQI
ncbi:hypothetical protein PR003_g27530 [Phytophthora rubi]|uniref:Uncharacterized protein n=1 Tax=Phytophthora rubi TaxID=129364 RepID=A0A6A4BXN6_9STRA|nr:hypothetical protein PR003_g27530 [Phytophthora rubi]